MSEGNESQRPTAGLGRSAPLLAVVLLLMAGWFGWSAFTQWQQADDGARLEQARDQAVDAVAKALAEQNAQLAQQLEREPVKAALAAGDAEAAASALHETWTVDDIQVLDAGLTRAYARTTAPDGAEVRHVLATPAGENALMGSLERWFDDYEGAQR